MKILKMSHSNKIKKITRFIFSFKNFKIYKFHNYLKKLNAQLLKNKIKNTII